MDMACIKSGFLRLAKNDIVKGFIMTAIGASLGGIYTAMQAGTIISMAVLKAAGMTGATAGVSYLLKNLFTNSQDQFAKPEPK